MNWYVLGPTHLIYMHFAQWHKEQLVEQDFVYCLQNARTSWWPVRGEAGTMYESIRHSHMYSHYVPLLRPPCHWLPLLGPPGGGLPPLPLWVLTSTPRTISSWTSRRPTSTTMPGSTAPRFNTTMTTPSSSMPSMSLYPSLPMASNTTATKTDLTPECLYMTMGRSLVFFHFFRRILYSVRGVRQTTWKQIKAMTK